MTWQLRKCKFMVDIPWWAYLLVAKPVRSEYQPIQPKNSKKFKIHELIYYLSLSMDQETE